MARPIYGTCRFFIMIMIWMLLFDGRDAAVNNEVPHINIAANEIYRINNTKDLLIYCYNGEPRTLFKAWTYSHVKLASEGLESQYKIFVGENATDVHQKYVATMSSWLTVVKFMVSWNQDLVSVAPFKRSCVGVHADSPYSARLLITRVDLTYFISTVAGIVLLTTANALSRNVVFYYGMGVSVGLLGSVLIAVFILSRFIPKKTGAAAVFLGGSSLVLYLFRWLWENLASMAYDRKEYILAYLGITSVISWAYLYYRGPPTDQRSFNLLKWAIQACGLLAVFCSVQLWEVSALLLTALLVAKNASFFDRVNRFRHWWQVKFPPQRRLLSHDEYIRQGQIETRKALQELRMYCRSPDCDTWRTVSRLKSPSRFASFVEGDTHVNDDELDEHLSRSHISLLSDMTDDESD